jgi:hypothetical protein
MRVDAFVTLLLVGLSLGVARSATAENQAQCDDLSLRFDVGGGTPYCYAGNAKGRDGGSGPIGWSVDWQFMGADTDAISRGVEVAIGNRRSWIEVHGVKARIEETPWFDAISDWGEPYKLDGYEVARFDATWGEMEYAWHCAGFVRYAVPAGSGYREALKGFISVAPYVELEEETVRGFLGSINY